MGLMISGLYTLLLDQQKSDTSNDQDKANNSVGVDSLLTEAQFFIGIG